MKEAPNGIEIMFAEAADSLRDKERKSGKAAVYPLDNENRSYLVAREKKKRKFWRTYTYEVVSFVPRDPLHGGEDQWLIEKASLPRDLRIHVSAENAVTSAGDSVKARKERFERKAEKNKEKMELGRWKALWRRMK